MFRTLSAALVIVTALLLGSTSARAGEYDNYDRTVTFRNFSYVDIVAIYISNVGSNSWGSNLLRRNQYVGARSEVDVDLDDGTGYCRFDIKVVFRDGTVAIKQGMNACTVGVLNIN